MPELEKVITGKETVTCKGCYYNNISDVGPKCKAPLVIFEDCFLSVKPYILKVKLEDNQQ